MSNDKEITYLKLKKFESIYLKLVIYFEGNLFSKQSKKNNVQCFQ